MLSTNKKIKPRVHERRIDELAWLLECSSMCTAASIINSRFYISANEFFSGTEQRSHNQHLNNVCNIMEYFQQVAKGSITWRDAKSKRDDLMQTICRNQIRTASLGRIVIPNNVIREIVCTDVLAREKLPNHFAPNLKKYIKKNKGFAYQALGYGIDIYKKFLKIEQSIRKALKGDVTEFNAEQLTAFKNFSYSDTDESTGNILFLEKDDNKDVHAEAQILNQIIYLIENEPKLTQEIYIGISKRCCRNCHCLLDAANEVLEEYGYVIKFSGAHDARFEDNWAKPPFLKQAELERFGRTRGETKVNQTKELSLKGKIREKYLEKIGKPRDNQSVERYAIRHSPSSSEVSSLMNIEIYKQGLMDDLEVLKKRGAGTTEQAYLLKLGIALCSVDQFTELFEMSPEIIQDKTAIIGTILTEFNKTYSDNQIEEKQLIKFLCNPIFAGKIYDYFRDFPTTEQIKDNFKEPEQKLQSVVQLLSENREQYREVLQKQQKLLEFSLAQLSDYAILTQYRTSTEADKIQLYQLTESLVSLNENLLLLQNKLSALSSEVQKNSFIPVSYKHLMHFEERIYGKIEEVKGDGWCALTAAGFDSPEMIVKILREYLVTDNDPQNIESSIINYLRDSIYNNYQAVFSLQDQQIVLEGVDNSNNHIAEKMQELYQCIQNQEDVSLKENSEELKEFFAYLETKEVQRAYLDYILKHKYADYKVILACLALEGRNRKVGLLVDYSNPDGKLVDLSEEGINFDHANCTWVIYKPGISPLLAHYDRFVLAHPITVERIDEVDKESSVPFSLSKTPTITPAFQLKKDTKRAFDYDPSLSPPPKTNKKKKGSDSNLVRPENNSAKKRWVMKP